MSATTVFGGRPRRSKDFPGAAGDVRQLDFGTFESTLGAASLRFYCQGSAVHAFVSARIQAERADRNQYAEVMFSVEAAAIDNFVEQLQNVNDEGEVATLVGADVP